MKNQLHIHEEGEACPEPGCPGTLEFPLVKGCSCHINPSCDACCNNKLTCDTCGFEVEEIE